MHLRSDFLSGAWNELFGADTPDTFRPRILHSRALVSELRDTAELALHDERNQKYLATILDELRVSVAQDPIVARRFPRSFHLWHREEKETDPQRLYHRAEFSLQDLKEYPTALIDELELVAKAEKFSKIDTQNLVRAVATEALLTHDDIEYCRSLLRDSRDATPLEVVSSIAQSLSTPYKTWRVGIRISGSLVVAKALAQKLGFAVSRNPDVISRLSSSESPAGTALEGSVVATTPRQAALEAATRVGMAVDAFNFFSNTAELALDDRIVAWSEGDGDLWLVNLASESAIQPRRDSLDRVRELIDCTTPLSDRLQTSLGHYRLGVAANDEKTKFLNFWVALETLFGGPGKDVLSRVQYGVVPFIMQRRVDRIARYIAIRLHRFGFGKSIRVERDIMPNAGSWSLPAESVLLALAEPCGGPRISFLLANAKDEHLRFRLWDTWRTLSSPANCLKDLQESRKRVIWQTERIYRARNLLFHRGRKTRHARRLLENLQYYVSVSLSRLLVDHVRDPDARIEKSIEERRLGWVFMSHSLAAEPDALLVRDFLTPSSHPDQSKRLWPSSGT